MTPIRGLAQIVSSVIEARWNELRGSARLQDARTDDVRTALRYLDTQQRRIERLTRSRLQQTVVNNEETSSAEFLAVIIMGMVVLAIVVANVKFIIENFRLVLIVGSAVGLVLTIEALVGPRLKGVFQYIEKRGQLRWLRIFTMFAAVGLPASWLSLLVRRWSDSSDISLWLAVALVVVVLETLNGIEDAWVPVEGDLRWLNGPTEEVLQSDRMVLLNVLSEAASTTEASAAESTGTDAQPLPAPPGLTEIVLGVDEKVAFESMRKHLTSVRSYHRVVLWALVLAFMAFFAVGVWKFSTRMQTPNDYLQAFGSAGIGGALLWFGQRALWANRVSQLSLALFESHMAEVNASLRELPANLSPDERRDARAAIWRTFREGLNGIWLTERNLLDTPDNISVGRQS
jgi:hypothetical protein